MFLEESYRNKKTVRHNFVADRFSKAIERHLIERERDKQSNRRKTPVAFGECKQGTSQTEKTVNQIDEALSACFLPSDLKSDAIGRQGDPLRHSLVSFWRYMINGRLSTDV